MIKFEETEVVGWEHVIRGMRNPMNSWEKSDTYWGCDGNCDECLEHPGSADCILESDSRILSIGANDHDLMMRLRNAGTDHRKFMRMITVYVDITAPLYWWKEFDTYKIGTVANSCSTMHKIHEKEFTIEDFSHEHIGNVPNCDPVYDITMEAIIAALNEARHCYLDTKDKQYWWQMIQLLPSSYNQKRTVMLNYEVLANMYVSRVKAPHKLDEWRVDFANWVKSLPYSEIITGISKSEKMIQLGEKLHEGFAKGLEKPDSKIAAAVESLAASAVNAYYGLSDAIKTIKEEE